MDESSAIQKVKTLAKPASTCLSKDRRFPLLNYVLDLDIAPNDFTTPLAHNPELRRQHLESFLVELLTKYIEHLRVAQKKCAVFIIEDLHCVDPASGALLLRLGRELHSLMLVVTARPRDAVYHRRVTMSEVDDPLAMTWPELYDHLRDLPACHSILLSGLNDTTCARLVCQRLRCKSLQPEIIAILMQRSKGNPLFVVELASHFQAAGMILVLPEGACIISPESSTSAMRHASAALPGTVTAMVTHRIDSLPPTTCLVCKLSSAFGSVVDRAVLWRLFEAEVHPVNPRDVATLLATHQPLKNKIQSRFQGGTEEELDGALTALQDAGILTPTTDARIAQGFAFCHELVQQAPPNPFYLSVGSSDNNFPLHPPLTCSLSAGLLRHAALHSKGGINEEYC